MSSAEVAAYVRDQLKAGYPPEEIARALREAGWDEQEVAEALQAETKPEVYPPVDISPPRRWGFVLGLPAGILVLVFGLGVAVPVPLLGMGLPATVSVVGMLSPIVESSLIQGVIAAIFGLVLLLGSLLMRREGRVGGVLVAAFSFLVILLFGGLFSVAGGILGIVGGITGILKG